MQNRYASIPGWFNFSNAYAEAIREAKPGAHFVEVGCWAGRSTAWLATEIVNSGKDITLYCVDHWQGSPEHEDNPLRAHIWETFNQNMAEVKQRMGEKLQIIRSDSAAAAKKFGNASVDFVWLDAGHDYDSVARDIKAWLPKVRPGHVLGGDDYPMEGVKEAVRELLPGVDQRPQNGWAGWWYRKPEAVRRRRAKKVAEVV